MAVFLSHEAMRKLGLPTERADRAVEHLRARSEGMAGSVQVLNLVAANLLRLGMVKSPMRFSPLVTDGLRGSMRSSAVSPYQSVFFEFVMKDERNELALLDGDTALDNRLRQRVAGNLPLHGY